MTAYAKHFNTKKTLQSEPIPGSAQVQNSAGGFSFAVDDWTRLERFLVLGSDTPSYYASERQLTVENAQAVVRCLTADGVRTVRTITDISVQGRAPKNSPAVFALALALSFGDQQAKEVALGATNQVCRTGTHVFELAEALNGLRGWGKTARRAIACWFTDKDARDLAYQVTKYQQRNGWSHRDLLRLSHAEPGTTAHQAIFRYITHGHGSRGKLTVSRKLEGGVHESIYPAVRAKLPDPIVAAEAAKKATTAADVVKLIEKYDLVRECVPTQWLNDAGVWAALLEKMPLTAMVRNLGKMTAVGLLRPLSQSATHVCDTLDDVEVLKKARVHPLVILTALRVYQQGHGEKGKLSWSPVPEVVDALDTAFYTAFQAVRPTNRRWMLALDVSGSMCWPDIAGMPGISPRVGSAAMALVTAAVEKRHHFVAFASGAFRGPRGGIAPLDISPRQRLDHVIRTVSDLNFGGTDCALPMLYATANKLEVDAFVVLTDSETWAGGIHPVQALREYRQKTGIPARLIVVGMVANELSIADPDDGGMLDVVGFDAAAPSVMADFVGYEGA